MRHLAIVGATGLVGRQMLRSLEERQTPIRELTLYASTRSAGEVVMFKEQPITVKELTESSIDPSIDVALFSAGANIALLYAPLFTAMGIVVIDNSSAFREDAPLIVPEVNPHHIGFEDRILANPNCSTIQSVVPLAIIHEQAPLEMVLYSTYQSVSGSGQKGMDALSLELSGEAAQHYPKAIAHNVIPHIDVMLTNGYTKEEQKMMQETRKILGLKDLAVSATCVRVPVFQGHAVSMTVRTQTPIDIKKLEAAFQAHQALTYHPSPAYPTPIEVAGDDAIHIGRLRRDPADARMLHFWCVADNIRKGAATNAVQILNLLLEERA